MNAQRKSILIVDDEEDLTWSISRSLRRHDDIFDVTCVNSGDGALDVLRSRRIDLVVSDIRMPRVDGFALIREIHERHPKSQIIIMTAYGSAQIQDEVNSYGTVYYIEKPFEIRYLHKLIYEALAITDEGFEELLVSSRIHDMLEYNCQTGRTQALSVSNGMTSGMIFLNKGEIVHAECGELVGESALHSILDWDRAEFSIVPAAVARRRTIRRRWQTLLNPKLVE